MLSHKVSFSRLTNFLGDTFFQDWHVEHAKFEIPFLKYCCQSSFKGNAVGWYTPKQIHEKVGVYRQKTAHYKILNNHDD